MAKDGLDERQNIRIRLKAFDHRVLDAVDEGDRARPPSAPARRCAGRSRCRRGSRSSPCNRSPHVDKKSREQFEIRTHKRRARHRRPDAADRRRADEARPRRRRRRRDQALGASSDVPEGKNMRSGVIAQKLGMTRVFTDDGRTCAGHGAAARRLPGRRPAHRGEETATPPCSSASAGQGQERVEGRARPFRRRQGRAEDEARRVPRRRGRAARRSAPRSPPTISSSASCRRDRHHASARASPAR